MASVFDAIRYKPDAPIAVHPLLSGALPETVAAYVALRNSARDAGIEWDLAPFGGLRTETDTATILGYRDADWKAAVARDPTLAQRTTIAEWRKIAPFGRSMHNYGAAFDVHVISAPDGWAADQALTWVMNAGAEAGLTDGRGFGDPDHLEINFGVPPGTQAVAAARARWQAENGTDFFGGVARSIGDIARDVTGDSEANGVDIVSVVVVVVVVVVIMFAASRKRRGHV